MDIFRMLDLLEKVEISFADLYKSLQHHHQSNKKTSDFFLDLHMEEESHVQLVLMERRIVKAAPKAFSEPDVNLSELNSILERVTNLKNAKLELPELIKQIYILEKSSAENYVIDAMKDTNEEIKEFLANLGGTFDDHRNKISEFARDAGIPLDDADNAPSRKARIGFTEGVIINDSIPVRSVDISEGGMFLLTGRSFSAGEVISLRFTVQEVTISVRATVQFHIPATGIGVKFIDLAPKDREVITTYISQRIREKGSTKVRRVVFVGNAIPNARENTRLFMNNLINAGYRVMDISGLEETISTLKKGLDLVCVVIAIESDIDTNYFILNYISTHNRYKNVPVLVLTGNQDKSFRNVFADREMIKLLNRTTTTPKTLVDEIKALTNY